MRNLFLLSALTGLLFLSSPLQAQEARVREAQAPQSRSALFSQEDLEQLMRYSLANYGNPSSGASRAAIERDLATFLKPEQLNFLRLMDDESRRWEKESILDRPLGDELKALQHKTLREWERLDRR